MTLTTFTLNGTPIEALGLGLVKPTNASTWRGIPSAARRTVTLPGVPGQVDLGDTPQYATRALPFRLLASPATLAQRVTILDDLARRFAGPVEIVSVEDPTRLCIGRLETLDVAHVGPALLTGLPFQADCQFVCDDPFWYDVHPVVLAIPAKDTRVTLPAGTAPTRRLMVRIAGPTSPTTVTVVLRDIRGEELARMTLATGTALSSSEALELDMEAMTITRITSGTAVDRRNYLAASEGYLALPAAVDTTLELSVASGTVSGTVTLTRAYRT